MINNGSRDVRNDPCYTASVLSVEAYVGSAWSRRPVPDFQFLVPFLGVA